jgi:hypothetical protein
MWMALHCWLQLKIYQVFEVLQRSLCDAASSALPSCGWHCIDKTVEEIRIQIHISWLVL